MSELKYATSKQNKGFLQRILQGIMKKNNTWNTRCLVNESFDPATQSIILKIIGFLAIETIDLINFKMAKLLQCTFYKKR